MKILMMMVLAAAAMAQEAPEAVEKIIEFKYLEGDQAERAIRLVREVSDAKIASDSVLRKIIIKGRADRVAAAEKLLRSLDTADAAAPNKRLDVTIRVLGAFHDAGAKRGDEIPADLEPVVKELRGTFAYKAYTLLDTVTLSGIAGSKVESGGNLISPDTSVMSYSTRFLRSGFDRESKAVTLNGFFFLIRSRNPATNQIQENAITSDVLVRPGQKLVLGGIKAGDANIACLLVISAKVD